MKFKDVPNSSSKDVYYKYELNGVMNEALFASNSGSGIKHTLNGFGEVLSTVSNNYGSRELQYTYDQHGNRTYVYHPDNKYVRYFYDKLDRPYRLQIHGSTFSWYNYDEFGRVDSIDRNVSRDGAPTSIGYDDLGRIESIEHDFDYTASDFNNTFTYNPASQLSSIHYANNQYQYIGNDKLTGSYAVNGLNQYTSVAGSTVEYDTKGNLYKHDGATYTYDDENRLTTVVRSGQSSFYLYYDPLGRLERTYTSGVGSRYFLWDGDALVAEYTSTSSSNSPAMRYAHGVGTDVPILQIEGSSTSNSYRRAIHADQRGSVVAYSDVNGNETNINSYDEYGIPGFENQGRFGFTGQLWLPEIGLYHYKARMYHPKMGRFLQTDPVGYEDQMNLYAYVGNDPMNMVDPSGMYGQGFVNASDRTVQVLGYKNVADANSNGPSDFKKSVKSVGSSVAAGAKGLAVGSLRVVAAGTGKISTGSLVVAAAATGALQPEIATPAAAISTFSGVVSAAASMAADGIETGRVSLDTGLSSAATATGLATTEVLGAASKLAPKSVQALGIAAEVAATVIVDEYKK